MKPILTSAKGAPIAVGIKHQGIVRRTGGDEVAARAVGVDELGFIQGAEVNSAAEVGGARVGLSEHQGPGAGEADRIAANNANNTVVVIKVAVGSREILEGEGAITNGFDVLAAIGVEGANEEHIAILAEHHRGIEAAAAGHCPAVECGSVAALGDKEARGEVATDGGAEGVGIG